MNRLAGEKSPYLLQHAGNPVDWYPWSDQAFEKARAEGKPVFLSIGYSTCHWCHVMEHESFADPEVAALMNAVFVSIKVDREERPDLDEHFMQVCQLLTGSGGWPLTVIMTAERRPFFAGTYFPRATMLELASRARDLHAQDRGRLEQSADAIAEDLQKAIADRPGGFTPGADTSARVVRSLHALYDSRNGGFGSAPKFPMPSAFPLLLRAWKRTGDPEALGMVERTLTAMRAGGIYDQVGFGFHRYSTDERWLVPHFEKMLYDQAQLATAYTEAWLATGKDIYQRVVRETLAYVLRDLSLPGGGFASAEDADSEGEEGRFYAWTAAEIDAILGPDSDAFRTRYRVMAAGNFVDQHGPARGRNILHREINDTDAPGQAEAALLAARAVRVRPFRDDKLLVDWNGLVITAFAMAGRAFEDPVLVDAAARAARFILGTMRRPNGRLLHRWRDGEVAIAGFADDYAFLCAGLVELYQATFDPLWLGEARSLADVLVTDFADEEAGGFSQTAVGEGDGLPRRKSLTDGVIPSANSLTALVLLKLAHLTGDMSLRARAEQILALYPEEAPDSALSFSAALSAADFAAGPVTEIVIVPGEDGGVPAMLGALRTRFMPSTVVIVKREGTASVAPWTAPLVSRGGATTAYACRGFTCSLPVTDAASLSSSL